MKEFIRGDGVVKRKKYYIANGSLLLLPLT
jgi:hypothetical protein